MMRRERIPLGPLEVRAQTTSEAIEEVLSQRATTVCLAFANTHLLYFALKDAQFADTLKRFVLFNDGVGIDLLTRLAVGRKFPENLNGTDFTPKLLRAAPGARVYLIGARRDVATRAGRRLEDLCGDIRICGVRDGYDDIRDEQALAEEVAAAAPDFVLVALGNPAQELLISRLAQKVGRGVFIGVGGLFDFLAEAKPRAPMWVRRVRLEWLYRMSLEPRRMWRRYTVEVLFVAFAVLRARKRSAESRP